MLTLVIFLYSAVMAGLSATNMSAMKDYGNLLYYNTINLISSLVLMVILVTNFFTVGQCACTSGTLKKTAGIPSYVKQIVLFVLFVNTLVFSSLIVSSPNFPLIPDLNKTILWIQLISSVVAIITLGIITFLTY